MGRGTQIVQAKSVRHLSPNDPNRIERLAAQIYRNLPNEV